MDMDPQGGYHAPVNNSNHPAGIGGQQPSNDATAQFQQAGSSSQHGLAGLSAGAATEQWVAGGYGSTSSSSTSHQQAVGEGSMGAGLTLGAQVNSWEAAPTLSAIDGDDYSAGQVSVGEEELDVPEDYHERAEYNASWQQAMCEVVNQPSVLQLLTGQGTPVPQSVFANKDAYGWAVRLGQALARHVYEERQLDCVHTSGSA